MLRNDSLHVVSVILYWKKINSIKYKSHSETGTSVLALLLPQDAEM